MRSTLTGPLQSFKKSGWDYGSECECVESERQQRWRRRQQQRPNQIKKKVKLTHFHFEHWRKGKKTLGRWLYGSAARSAIYSGRQLGGVCVCHQTEHALYPPHRECRECRKRDTAFSLPRLVHGMARSQHHCLFSSPSLSLSLCLIFFFFFVSFLIRFWIIFYVTLPIKSGNFISIRTTLYVLVSSWRFNMRAQLAITSDTVFYKMPGSFQINVPVLGKYRVASIERKKW